MPAPIRIFGPLAALLLSAAPGVSSGISSLPPRTPDGIPDFNGYYQLQYTPDMSQGREHSIPYTAQGRAAFLQHDEKDDPAARCLSPGVPRIMQSFAPAQFVQTKSHLVILFEYMHTFRSIPLDGRPHVQALEPSFLGDSVGRWDGDTLEVDTVDFKDGSWTWLDWAGHQHSSALHLVERFQRTPAGIQYEYTIHDPVMYAKPWTLKRSFTPLQSSGKFPPMLMEFECNENNLDAVHLVSTKTDSPLQSGFWYRKPLPARIVDPIVAWGRAHRAAALGLTAAIGALVGSVLHASWPALVQPGRRRRR